jgi:hypothetical protein
MRKPLHDGGITIRIQTSDYPLVSLFVNDRPILRTLHTGSAFILPIKPIEDEREPLTKEGLHRMFESGAIKQKWIVLNII